MKHLVFIFCLFCIVKAVPQEMGKLTLEDCYKHALENYPALKQKPLHEQSRNLKFKNLNIGYLPHVTLNAQASYQSDVTKFNIELPSSLPFQIDIKTPELYKDVYKVTLDLRQMIYDGGTVENQKITENINYQINQQNVELEFYQVKEQINELYFNLLLLRENEKILQLTALQLKSKLNDILSGVKHGMLLQSSANQIEAELLAVEQKIIEIRSIVTSNLASLEEIISKKLSQDIELQIPEREFDLNSYENQRIEYGLLTLQQQKNDVIKAVISSRNRPHLSGYSQLGYGRPGLNMLSEDFDTYYLLGASISWNFWDWNQSRNEKQMLQLASEIIDVQKEIFNKGLRIERETVLDKITMFEELISKDREIIRLRKEITETASSQLDNGTISVTEYLTELNLEKQALLKLETHKIQLIKAKIDLISLHGKL